jgi:hypothetical protein
MTERPGENVDENEIKARNFVYDGDALRSVFHFRNYAQAGVKRVLEIGLLSLERKFPHLEKDTPVMTRLPGMGFMTDYRGTLKAILAELDEYYKQREPLIIAVGLYMRFMQKVGWNEREFKDIVRRNLEFLREGGDISEMEVIDSDFMCRFGVSQPMYEQACEILSTNLDSLFELLRTFKGQIQQIDGILKVMGDHGVNVV